ncbi:MAG: NlpC/P60 family protein [Chloroflexota bacterium]
MMGSPLVSLAMSGLGRDAMKAGAGLVLAVVIALAFALSCLLAIFGIGTAGSPPPPGPGIARLAAVAPQTPNPEPAQMAAANPAGAAAITLALANLGSQRWHDPQGNSLCEQFVENMYGTTGEYPSATAAWQAMAPADPGQLARQREVSTAPAGARVYFSEPYQPAGHTGIYLGNGQFIAANDVAVQVWNVGQWQAATGQTLLGWVG